MATDTTDSPISDALRNQASDDRLIQKKLRKTRWQLKIAELAAACMLFAAGAIAFLLLLAVVDHWVLNLSFPLRLAALAFFLGSAGYFAWSMILPLLWRTISPVYAARMIEQGQPALKNGLINFLLLKQEATPIHRAVLDTVQQRAASDLKEYATETTVDFSKAIRIGYVFAAVALAFVVYKIASPKDPLTTVHRVISPWADIARPSRVDIVEVLPGDVQIYQGQTVEVAVKVYNFDDDEQVELFFSSADRRIVDQKVTLEPDESGLYFRGVIAPEGQGIQHNLAYFVKAGDATTRDYNITATPAPSIEVVDIRYDYPAYTMETPLTQVRDGAVKALEGTRVTVRAISNLPMEDAFIEFDPDAGDHANAARTKMTVSADDPTSAIGTFVIELLRHPAADDPAKIAATPKHRRYQLRFKTAAGDLNPYPVAYPIEVIRDLSPEVQLLRPTGDKIRVPANGGAALEFRAIDPDYAVRQLTVIGEVEGKERLRTPLLQQSTTGNVIETYRFVPREQKLKPGDLVTIYALAEDNRTDSAGRPTPNVTTSRSLTIEITEPEQGAEKQIPPKQDDKPQDGQPQDGEKGGEQMKDGQQGGEKQEGGQQGGEKQEGGQQGGEKQEGGQQGGEKQEGGQQGGEKQEGGQQGGEKQEGGQQGGAKQEGGQQGGEKQEGGQQGGEKQEGGQQGGEKQEGGQQGGGMQEGGQQGGTQQGAQDPNQNAPPKPLAADDSQAGDAFERIQKYLEKKEQEAGGAKSGEQESAMPGDKADGGASQPKDSGQPNRDHEATENQSPEKGGEPKPSESGVDSDADNSGQEGGMKSEGDKPEDQQAGRQRGEGEMKDQQGDESGGDSEKGAPTESEEKSDPMGEERTGDNGVGDAGKSGTGNPGADEDQGSPSSPDGAPNTPSDKMGKPDSGEEKSEQGPKSAVGDHKENKQNNSKGESDGDRSGGGDSGGGQSAKQEGHDSPGESSAADKGSSASKQRGEGEEGSKGGDQSETDKKTGAPGEEKGDGSGRDDKGDGDKSGGGKPGEPNEQTGQKPESGGESNQYGDGNPTGGGGMPSDQNATPDAGGPEHGGDEANLDYARKATDLVLDKLEHDQKEPDQELLNELGWSKEQFREFTQRWKAMKQAADSAAPGSEAKQELDEALRSLGLTPGKDQLRRNESNSAQQGGAADVNRSRPPAAFLEQYKAYLKGSAKQAPR
ncbi:hypothetical protein M4951_08725 [Blastopirellula sp. J2-11]|uniref:hypothetical protein n=1 Tax=Blastopirellula sp. J2-11 TaxID=2943192 RepID=UPI0021CAACED|nr:hypothetical protein [Blastopirellula sp. J2-11]UUO08385.1 hypothetical protein M4951_08725 [Blastopirellula sp. J2-11]